MIRSCVVLHVCRCGRRKPVLLKRGSSGKGGATGHVGFPVTRHVLGGCDDVTGLWLDGDRKERKELT